MWLLRGGVEGWTGSLGLADANSYIEWINKALLYGTENYSLYRVINHSRKEYEKECVYIHIHA